ncbi:MAG: ATP-binding protein [Pseudomonadota bacterium]
MTKVSRPLNGDQQARILGEQTRMLYEGLPLAGLATLLNASLLVAVQWPVIAHSTLLAWLVAVLVVTLGRVSVAYLYRRARPKPVDALRWARHFVIGALLASLCWGASTILLFPADQIAHQVFLAFVIGGMCAGAVTTLSFLRPPILAFLLCCLPPLAWQFFGQQSTMSLAMGLMVLFFLAITLMSGLRIYRNTLQNITLRLESDARERNLLESEERYRLIFESAPLGVIHYDTQGAILRCNESFCEMLGASFDKIIGLNMRYTLDDPKLIEAVTDSLDGRTGLYEGSSQDFLPYRDTLLRGYFRGITGHAGEILGGVAIIEDVTEEKRIERMKDEFISTVSHELRTPLTAIRGSIGLISEGFKREMPEKAVRLAAIAYRNTERLLLLIDDILSIEKIAAGKMQIELQPLQVMDFLGQALQAHAGLAKQYQIELAITERDDSATVLADPNRLMQALGNLLSNAAKFSPSGATVRVGAQRRGAAVRIFVQDDGPGIPASFHNKIFTRFAQYDTSDSRRAGGTGLGLYIAKSLVELHHGQIGFDSREGAGSTFHITLPLLPPQ